MRLPRRGALDTFLPDTPLQSYGGKMQNTESDRPGASGSHSNLENNLENVEQHVIETLSQRALSKLLSGDITLQEAASRLVGCGRFEENSEAVPYLEKEIFPQIELRLEELETEIAERTALARKLRAIVHPESAASLTTNPDEDRLFESAQAQQERSRKEKSRKKKMNDDKSVDDSAFGSSIATSVPSVWETPSTPTATAAASASEAAEESVNT